MIPCQEPLRGMLTLMFKKFGIFRALAIAVGILGALKFGRMGVHLFNARTCEDNFRGAK